MDSDEDVRRGSAERKVIEVTEFDRSAVSREPVAGSHREASGLGYQVAMVGYLAAVAGAEDHPAVAVSPQGQRWDLDDVPVRAVMTRPVIAVEEGVSFRSVAETLTANRISAVPVVDGTGVLVGIVSESDLLATTMTREYSRSLRHRLLGWRKAHTDVEAETARQLMTTPVVSISADAPVVSAARAAARAHVRRLPVVDDSGRPVGIVTRSDLLRVFLRPDDDVRVDIVDGIINREFALDQSAVDVSVQDGSVTLSGMLESRSLVKQLVDATHRVAGVVAVHNQLHYRVEDTRAPASIGPLY